MDKIATVYFDGDVFRPETPIDLEPNALYVISIQAALESPAAGTLSELLRNLAGKVEGPPDWSAEHNHYIHGSPKNGKGPHT